MSKRRRAVKEPPALAVPVGRQGDTFQIIYGANAQIRKVLMQFGCSVSALTLTPDDARHVAQKLAYYADVADGKVTS